jgi:drug/metabolite transporter (DMT)-like permease
MATKLWAALLVLLTTLLTSSAQILWKIGSENLEFNMASILTNYPIFGGILLYMIGGVLLILSFRGGEVSVLYPIIATGYIWVSILSVRYLGEEINPFKWVGIIIIISGISLIGFGSRNSDTESV